MIKRLTSEQVNIDYCTKHIKSTLSNIHDTFIKISLLASDDTDLNEILNQLTDVLIYAENAYHDIS